MSWVTKLLGLGGNATETVSAVAEGLDGLFTSDDERLTHKEVIERLRQEPDKAQMAVNAIEAQHRKLFVAGWRPFIGWVCGLALAYQYLFNPLIIWIVTLTVENPIYPPALDMSVMMPVLLGMLGLGGLRTVEKLKKISK